ncbi:hypothetical protein SAMN04487943_10771 [Gracilibacillus orientalis]|uniref:Uncharacterized protein n=1 Tax=Gracilibacillus orientalis TaxID=334253 RepID=A0A1I4MTE4_9BACI|nr:hypothetical protein [Gracilibacillus orientalis]SFM06326.1 hypothetical protein SAMN04487943_10771 [Gracilibacillus orientalis]
MPIRLIVLFIVNIVNIYFVKIFTVEPDVISGNGNLGVLFLIIGYILLLFFSIELRKVIRYKYLISKRLNLIILLVSILILAITILSEYRYVVDLINQLGGFGNPESVIYRLSFLNQYTNTMFLNIYIFIIIISLIMMINSVEKLFHKQ